jgi:hypothetical protein
MKQRNKYWFYLPSVLQFGMREVKFWQIKPEIRVLGIDDGPLQRRGKVPLIGVVFRGNRWVEGVLKTEITHDGTDVTDRLIGLVKSSRQRGQIRVIMTDGVTFAGFNVLDVKRVFEELELPLIAVSRTRPNMQDILLALKNLPDWRWRWGLIRGAGKIYEMKSGKRKSPVYIQPVGLKLPDAERIVEFTRARSAIPEPVRVAHMIATALVRGESHGGA